jgi:ankyrin repeat protein
MVRLLLQSPATRPLLDLPDAEGRTALGHAMLKNAPVDVVSMLVAAGADVDRADLIGEFPLYWARNGDVIRMLIDAGANVDKTTSRGLTALHRACLDGDVDVVSSLCSRSAGASLRGPGGSTALMMAAERGHCAVAEYLLGGCTIDVINMRDHEGQTALLLSVRNRAWSIAVALLAAGADVGIATAMQHTPLMVCASTDVALLLLEHRASVDARGSCGETALMLASGGGPEAMVRLLLDRRADAAAADTDGVTALMLACDAGRHAVVTQLLGTLGPAATSIDAINPNGMTSLIVAVQRGALGCVRALAAAGADPNIVDAINGRTALHYARDAAIARALVDAGARDSIDQHGYSTLMCACERGRVDVVRLLVDGGFEVDVVSEHLSTLIIASLHGHHEIMCVLAKADPPAQVDLQALDGCTALFAAARNNQFSSVRLLLGARADPLIRNSAGRIAITYARRSPDCVRLLVEAVPAMVHVTDSRGRGVLAWLCGDASASDAVAELFRSSGDCDISVKVDGTDANGDSSLHIAMVAVHRAALRILLDMGAKVLESGYEDTTVLMKPFLGASLLSEHYSHVHPLAVGAAAEYDAEASACLELVLQHITEAYTGTGSTDPLIENNKCPQS